MATTIPTQDAINGLNDNLKSLAKIYPDLAKEVSALSQSMALTEQASLQKMIAQVSKSINADRVAKGEDALSGDALVKEAMLKVKVKDQVQGEGVRVMGQAEVGYGAQLAEAQVYPMINILLAEYARIKEQNTGKKNFEADVLSNLDPKKGNKDNRLALAIGTMIQSAHKTLGKDPSYAQFIKDSSVNGVMIHEIVHNLKNKNVIFEPKSASPTPPPIPTEAQGKKQPPPIPTEAQGKKQPPPIPGASATPPPIPKTTGIQPAPLPSEVKKQPPPIPTEAQGKKQPPPIPDYAKTQQMFGHKKEEAKEPTPPTPPPRPTSWGKK